MCIYIYIYIYIHIYIYIYIYIYVSRPQRASSKLSHVLAPSRPNRTTFHNFIFCIIIIIITTITITITFTITITITMTIAITVTNLIIITLIYSVLIYHNKLCTTTECTNSAVVHYFYKVVLSTSTCTTFHSRFPHIHNKLWDTRVQRPLFLLLL